MTNEVQNLLRITKIALGVMLAGYSLPAFADAGSDSPRSSLGDPAWFADQGQFFGSTGMGYDYLAGKASHFGVQNSYHYTSTDITQALGYGITDRFMVTLSENYVPWAKHDDDEFGGSKTEYGFDGFGDPAISANYRVIDERSAPLNVDIYASFSPDVIKDKYASIGNTGSVSRGNNATSFDIDPSYITKQFTVRGVFGTTWYSSGSADTAGDTETYSQSSYWEYYTRLETQTRLNDYFAINANISEIFDNNINVNPSTYLPYTAQHGDETIFGLGFQVTFIPNQLVLSVLDQYQIQGNNSDHYANPVYNYTYTDIHGNDITATLQYTF